MWIEKKENICKQYVNRYVNNVINRSLHFIITVNITCGYIHTHITTNHVHTHITHTYTYTQHTLYIHTHIIHTSHTKHRFNRGFLYNGFILPVFLFFCWLTIKKDVWFIEKRNYRPIFLIHWMQHTDPCAHYFCTVMHKLFLNTNKITYTYIYTYIHKKIAL